MSGPIGAHVSSMPRYMNTYCGTVPRPNPLPKRSPASSTNLNVGFRRAPNRGMAATRPMSSTAGRGLHESFHDSWIGLRLNLKVGVSTHQANVCQQK